jgi:hypothetical protein
MKSPIFLLLGWASVIPLGAQSHFSYSTELSGLSERPLPTVPSLASGIAEISLDILPAFTTVTWNIRWAGLSDLPTAAHFHGPAGTEESASALFSLGNFFTDSTPSSGGFSGVRQLSDAAQISAIRDGMAYVDIHTESYPDGEIRGQLQAIAEPSTLAFMGGMAAALALMRLWKTAGPPGQRF